MLSGRVRSKTCPSHQQQLRNCRCISAWEPRPCPKGNERVSKNPCSEDASKSKPSSQSRKPGVHLKHPVPLGGLAGGFVGRFCARLVDFRGAGRRRIFCFWLADFPAIFWSPQKSTAKIHQKSTTSMAAFWKISTVG